MPSESSYCVSLDVQPLSLPSEFHFHLAYSVSALSICSAWSCTADSRKIATIVLFCLKFSNCIYILHFSHLCNSCFRRIFPVSCPIQSIMSIPTIRVASSARNRANSLLRAIQAHPPSCPCHSNPTHHHRSPSLFRSGRRSFATPLDHSQQKEYAFEMVRPLQGYRGDADTLGRLHLA
jgi:hypothetical protein